MCVGGGWFIFHTSSTHLTPSQPCRVVSRWNTVNQITNKSLKGEKGEQENSVCLEEPETEYFLMCFSVLHDTGTRDWILPYVLFCFTWYGNQRLNTSFMWFSVLHDMGTRDWILPYVLFCFTWYGNQRLNTSFMWFSVLHDTGTRDWILPLFDFLFYMIRADLFSLRNWHRKLHIWSPNYTSTLALHKLRKWLRFGYAIAKSVIRSSFLMQSYFLTWLLCSQVLKII